MIEELSYNLPGYGFAKCYIMGQAIDLMNLLSGAGLIEKMQGTCQLGTMKYVYPGAHHTRYEYVFTQLLLISNVVSVEKIRYGVDFSKTSELKEYEEIDKISGGAVMQCLAILSNAGHMYDTFTSSRILMQLLLESKRNKTPFYQVYRRNLPESVQNKFDILLDSGNFYKLHLFNMLHIMQGLSRSGKVKNLCQLCSLLITQLIDPSLIQNEATARVFSLYKKIRKIAYLSVDMIYTPASFGANLNRMIYSIPSYVDDLFDESSVMNKSIQQLEDVIHHQIYNAPTSIAQEIRNRFTSDNVPDGDQLHEILSCANVLDMISYAGVVICFVGGIKASKYQKSEKIDELDGFIYFPNREAKNPFAYIIEAKNYLHGERDAQRQLENTKKFLLGDLTKDIHPGARCAYMEISYKN